MLEALIAFPVLLSNEQKSLTLQLVSVATLLSEATLCSSIKLSIVSLSKGKNLNAFQHQHRFSQN
jgi:hypothetical protein